MDTYRNFINGEWVESESSKTAKNVNPANTDDVIGTNKQATRAEAKRAVDSAAENFPAWRGTPAPTRGKLVARAARLFEEHKEELARILTREEGKTLAESRGELQRSINVADFCAGESRRMNGETIQSEPLRRRSAPVSPATGPITRLESVLLGRQRREQRDAGKYAHLVHKV